MSISELIARRIHEAKHRDPSRMADVKLAYAGRGDSYQKSLDKIGSTALWQKARRNGTKVTGRIRCGDHTFWLDQNRIHRFEGPAIHGPNLTTWWFLYGIEVRAPWEVDGVGVWSWYPWFKTPADRIFWIDAVTT